MKLCYDQGYIEIGVAIARNDIMTVFTCVRISRHQNCLNNDKVRKNSIKALSKMLEMNFTELYKHSKKDTYEIIE